MAAEEIEETNFDDRNAKRHNRMSAGEQDNRILHGGGIGSSS